MNDKATDMPSHSYTPPAGNVACIGVTGGIGSGKSYICRQIEAAGHPVFYCDDVAKQIIRTDPDVQRELTAIVGDGIYDAEGKLVKSVLAAYLCRGRQYSAQVDAVVHPRVAKAFMEKAKMTETDKAKLAADNDAKDAAQAVKDVTGELTVETLQHLPCGKVLFMECALLFESGFCNLVHRSVLVHTSHETQISRLMARDGISRQKALEWMALQLSEEEKLARADAYLPND